MQHQKAAHTSLSQNKRGQVTGVMFVLITASVLLVTAVVVNAVVAKVNSDVGTSFTAGSVERGITENGSAAIANLAGNLPLIGTVLGLGVVIAILLAFLLRNVVGNVR